MHLDFVDPFPLIYIKGITVKNLLLRYPSKCLMNRFHPAQSQMGDQKTPCGSPYKKIIGGFGCFQQVLGNTSCKGSFGPPS